MYVYYLMHVGGVILMTGYTFRAFAAPPDTRKGTLAIAGILALVTLVGAFGLLQKLGLGYPGWAMAKLGCWVGLAALAGLGYRMPGLRSFWALCASALVLIAVYLVYVRPF